MKPKPYALLFISFFAFFTPVKAQLWTAAKRFSSANSNFLNSVSTCLDSDGNVYVAGNFQNTISFGAITLQAYLPGLNHGYLLKLDPQLQPVWARVFPQNTYDVTVDLQHNVLVVGSHWKKVNPNDSLAFVVKYSANGDSLGSFSAGGSAQSWAKVIRVDSAGNAFVAGERFSSGNAVFGSFSFPPTSSRECFLLRLSPDFKVDWAVYTGNSGNLDNVYDLELDEVNHYVYASGNYSQQCGNLFCTFYNGDFFVEKHQTGDGSSVWKKVFSGGSGNLTKQFSRISPDGQSLAVAACFKSSTQFDPSISLTANPSNDDYHIYLTQLNTADAQVQWAKKISTSGDSYLWRMARNQTEIFLYGYFIKPTQIGSISLTPAGYDGFLAKIATDGTILEAEPLSGSGPDFGYGLALRDSLLAVSGISSSSSFKIGTFNVPGNSPSVFVALKGSMQIAAPVAGFSIDSATGCAPLAVQFTNTSIAEQGVYQWQFPGADPSSSAEANPQVFYHTPGVYPVTLIVHNSAGSDTISMPAAITVLDGAPAVSFTSVVDGQTVSFSSVVTGASTCTWNFGDGEFSTEENPVHLYAGCDTYLVTLTCSNTCGSAESSSPVNAIELPNAIFTFAIDSFQISVTNNATGGSSYFWDFGDSVTSNEQDPAPHMYTSPGTYTVTLIATNSCGVSIYQQNIMILACPVANFEVQLEGLTANFVNLSQLGDVYHWDFGDGQSSMLENPDHTYAAPGAYIVALTVINDCGSSVYRDTVNVLPLGVKSLSQALDIRLSPNPAKAEVLLEVAGELNSGIRISVVNASGQAVFSQMFVKQEAKLSRSLDLNQIPPGVYVFQVQAQESIWTQKLVLVR